MTLLEDVKRYTQRLTGWRRPSATQGVALVRKATPSKFRFADDGVTPNHPRWPLIVFRQAVDLPDAFDPAAVFEAVFENNGWGDTWRGEIYDYVHYHSRIHEALGIARGSAKVRFGGSKGRILTLRAGDVVILPAGTGHQALSASADFLAVGSYPPFGLYDECGVTDDEKKRAEEYRRAKSRIEKVGRPRKDPVYGAGGPLLTSWEAKKVGKQRKERPHA